MKGKCNNCAAEYELRQNDIKIKRIPNTDIEETYFECKKCNEHYTVAITNKEVRENLKKIQYYRERVVRTKNTERKQEFQERLEEMVKENKILMDQLRKSFTK